MPKEVLVSIITAIGAVILALVNILVTARVNSKKSRKKELEERNKEIFDRLKLLKSANQALLRDRLYSEHNRLIQKGWATYDEKENFENMYVNYHNLGVNGVMDGLRDQVIALTTKEIHKKNCEEIAAENAGKKKKKGDKK